MEPNIQNTETLKPQRRCITCRATLPETTERLEYFARARRSDEEDDCIGHADDVNLLLAFAGAVCNALMCLTDQDSDHLPDDTMENLSWLGRELTEEAKRRAWALYQAGAMWRARVKGPFLCICPRCGGPNASTWTNEKERWYSCGQECWEKVQQSRGPIRPGDPERAFWFVPLEQEP